MINVEVINKMDADELRNYVHKLQTHLETIKEINKELQIVNEFYISLIRHKENLEILETNKALQDINLGSIACDMERKYPCPEWVCKDLPFEKGEQKE